MSAVLDYVRSQEPFFKTVDDETLTDFLGSNQPWTLEADPDFKATYQSLLKKKLGGALEQVNVPDVKSLALGTAPIIPEDEPTLPEQRELDPLEKAMRVIRRIPGTEKLVGPEVPGTGAGGDIENRGLLPTLASIPGRVAGTAGKFAQAGLGDIASAVDARGDQPTGAADFGGNVKELLAGHGETRLPIEQGMALSKEQDRDEHALGWQTISADIALGLADMAPKIAMMEAAPGGALPKAGAAASIFGADEKGNLNPRNAAFAALYPFVTSAAAKVTDAAIEKAVDRGFEWAGSPSGQNALHIAANQAAMNALTMVQSSPELSQLANTDPAEFKRELAKILGSNLAFAIPEAMERRTPIIKAPTTEEIASMRSKLEAAGPPPAPMSTFSPSDEGEKMNTGPEPPAPQFPAGVRDLAAELKAAMEKNEIVPQVPEQGPPSSQASGENAAPEANGEAAFPTAAEKPAETPEPAVVAAPAAESERPINEATAPGSDVPAPEQSAEAGGGGGLSARVEPTVGQEAEPVKRAKPSFFIRPRSDGQFDVLDAVQDLGGMKPPGQYSGGEYDGWKEAMTGPARLLIKRGSKNTPDTILAELSTVHGLDFQSPDDLFEAIKRATAERERLRTQGGGPEAQTERFWSAATDPKTKSGLEKINVQDLKVGDKFRLRAPGVSHEELTVTHVDPDTSEVTVKDGSSFGIQDLPDGAEIWVKRGSLESAPSSLEQWADKTIQGSQGRLSAGIDPELLAAYAIKGAFHVARIARQVAVSFNEWSIQMLNEFGASVAPHLRTIWPESLKLRQQQITQEIAGTKEQSPERRNLAREASEVQQQMLKAAAAKNAATGEAARAAKPATGHAEPDAGIEAQRAEAAVAGTEDSSVIEQPPAQPTETRTVEPRDWHEVQREFAEASDALRAAIHLTSEPGGRSRPQVKQEQAMAAARYHNLREELLTNPRYVEDLLKRQQTNIRELQAEPAPAPLRHQELQAEQEDIRAKLTEIEPKLINQVYAGLLKGGQVPKPPVSPPIGRSLDQVTDDLRRAGAVSPKRSLRERIAVGEQLADRWNNIKDSFESARMKLATAWRTALESYKHPPVDTGFRNVIKDWLFADQWTGQQTHDWVKTINQKVENPLRQMAMSVWLDAKGDESLLKYQAAAVPERFAKIWRLATQLTEGEKAIARQIKSDFDAKLEDALNAGLLKQGRADYGVPQVWKKAPVVEPNGLEPHGSPGNWQAKLDPRDPFFAFQRSHPTYFDGILNGGVPADLRIGTLAGVYNTAFHKSLSSRAMIFALKQEAAADGMPIVRISGNARQVSDNEPGAYFVDSKARSESDASKDGRPYRTIDHFALRDWKIATKTSEGKPIIVKGDMLVHPDHYEFLKNELLQSPLREGKVGQVLGPVVRSGAFLKASKMAFAGFHLMTIGEHMVSHLVNPFTNGFKIDLREPDQALLVRNGLELGMTGPQVAFEEGLASHGGLFRQIPGLGDLSAKITDWMFKDYIPTIMMKTGLHALEANRRRYGKRLSDGQIAELTAQQMNAAGGLQNYRLLGRNKTLMDLSSLAMLAPQFLESRAKVVAQALKPYGAEQRKMLLVQAAVMYAGCRVLNWLFDEDAHWEPAAAFGVVHNGRMYGIRTIVGDMWHMVNDPASFAAGRLSPFARMAYETMTQRDLRTGARKEPPIQTNWAPGRVAQNLVVDLAKWLMPIGVEGLLPGAAGREQGPVTTAAAAFGLGSHKYTAQTQVYGWAKDFNRNGDAAARTFQRHQDADVHSDSPYRKMDALLDAGRSDQAKVEYDALVKDGHTVDRIAQRYDAVTRPFTGNSMREAAFRQSLSASQQQMYDRALAERRARQQAFYAMLRAVR